MIHTTEEEILMLVDKASDKVWGGFFDLIFTTKRIIVDYSKGVTTGETIGMGLGLTLGGPLVHAAVSSAIRKRHAEKSMGNNKTIDDILKSHEKNYAIAYDDVQKIRLRRKSLPIGYSELKIESGKKKSNLAFKRDKFDAVSSVLVKLFQDKIEVR